MSERNYWKRGYYDRDRAIPFKEVRRFDACEANDTEAEWFTTPHFLNGDYCGNGVYGRANIAALRERFGKLEGSLWWFHYGSYSSQDVYFAIAANEHAELAEFLSDLEEYPVADENILSEIEFEDKAEAWEQFGADDFRRCLQSIAPHHDALIAALPNEALSFVWSAIADEHRGGEDCVHEQSGPYFPFDSVFGERAGKRRIGWRYVRPILIDALACERTIARTCGTAETFDVKGATR